MNDEIELSPYIKQERTDANDAIEMIAKNQELILLRLEEITKRQNDMTKMISEHNNLLIQAIGYRNIKNTKFPLKTEEDLQEINTILQGDSRSEIVTMLENILSFGGIQENFTKILSQDLIVQFNLDGFKGKGCLKTYQAFMDALFEATSTEGRTHKEFYNDIRLALKISKNRFHKQRWRQKQLDPLESKE